MRGVAAENQSTSRARTWLAMVFSSGTRWTTILRSFGRPKK